MAASTTYRRAAVGIMGAGVLVGAWWGLAATVFTDPLTGSRTLPTPPEVVAGYVSTGVGFYLRNFSVTLHEAALGFAWGNAIALVLAGVALLLPRLEGVVAQLATVTYCVPIVAIGPLALIVIGAPAPGSVSGTAVLLAAMSVFFTTVVGALLGLRAADTASLDVVAVYGGTRFTQLRRVRVVAAVPAVLSALQVAVPSAVLGAVLGEFFGKVERGVGPAMVAAQQSVDAPRVWGIALACGAVALVGFGALGLVARFATPWSRGSRVSA